MKMSGSERKRERERETKVVMMILMMMNFGYTLSKFYFNECKCVLCRAYTFFRGFCIHSLLELCWTAIVVIIAADMYIIHLLLLLLGIAFASTVLMLINYWNFCKISNSTLNIHGVKALWIRTSHTREREKREREWLLPHLLWFLEYLGSQFYVSMYCTFECTFTHLNTLSATLVVCVCVCVSIGCRWTSCILYYFYTFLHLLVLDEKWARKKLNISYSNMHALKKPNVFAKWKRARKCEWASEKDSDPCHAVLCIQRASKAIWLRVVCVLRYREKNISQNHSKHTEHGANTEQSMD